jgi:hypothetical protein
VQPRCLHPREFEWQNRCNRNESKVLNDVRPAQSLQADRCRPTEWAPTHQSAPMRCPIQTVSG